MDLAALQKYMRQALGSHPPLQGRIGQRIYDRVPGNGAHPYITIGIAQGVNQSIDCLDDWEVTAEVHVWSRAVGMVEAKEIAALCDDALAERYPAFPEFIVRRFEMVQQRWLQDPDGLTTHGVLEYRSHYGPED